MHLGKRTEGCERDSGCHSDELEEAGLFPSGTGHQTGRQAVEALMKGARCADTLQGDLGISGPRFPRSLRLGLFRTGWG